MRFAPTGGAILMLGYALTASYERLWSAPAKRRNRIEPRRQGIPAAFAGNLGTGLHTRRGDGAFPWPPRVGWGTESKAAARNCCFDQVSVTSGPADFCQYRGKVAAALQNVNSA